MRLRRGRARLTPATGVLTIPSTLPPVPIPNRALLLSVIFAAAAPAGRAQDSAPRPPQPAVYVRFRVTEPTTGTYYIRFHTRIHRDPWNSPEIVIPEGAERDETKRLPPGRCTPWTDITRMTHGRLDRCGGVAEFSCGEANVIATGRGRRVEIELAPAPDEARIVKRMTETAVDSTVMFLVSPNLQQDAADLESGTQMAQRHLAWAREATGGKRVSPRDMLLCTGIWGSPDPALTLPEAEALWLLGLNVVGASGAEAMRRFDFGNQDYFWAECGPGVTREGAVEQVRKHKQEVDNAVAAGGDGAESHRRSRLLVFSDEIRAPAVGTGPGVERFRRWLAARGVEPAAVGAARLEDVTPIDTWKQHEERAKTAGAAASRLYYYTCRFVQDSATERIRWITEASHEAFGPGLRTATLPADFPYFGGSGLGGGDFGGGDVVAIDWFDLARRRAVDVIQVEDWLGLNYMYGPRNTWEGFQLLGFECSIYRSASRGTMPIQPLLTPGNERNLVLKAFSCLAQGATAGFWFWHYGPTYLSTENYWSDIPGACKGVARIARACAAAEDLLVPGRFRPTKVALLYSISSDIWRPFGYAHMLERRLTYFALIHRQYLVDLLTEEDVEAGRLKDYDVLYITDPCVSRAAVGAVARWAEAGGRVYGACAAAGRDEFNQPQDGLSAVFGVRPGIRTTPVPGTYDIRGELGKIAPNGTIRVEARAGGPPAVSIEGLGVRVGAEPAGAEIVGTFEDGSPGVFAHRAGKGRALYVAACPAIAYARRAGIVPDDLREQWPEDLRAFITAPAAESGAPRVVECSHPVVEAGLYESERGIAVTLANFTYKPIDQLDVIVPCAARAADVTSAGGAPVRAEAVPGGLKVTLPLTLGDIVMIRWKP